ncbi:MAG: cytochrome ubiquinol oxidase subunit I [Nitrospira sp.]|uniref:Ubiquinol oxidase (Electrogenic, proton-motive force generating) n=1 Tax=Nitrospira defluvii TaxID=330214 RepID=A0ABN7KIK7_9BACT|nr:cytochrome ubiquinol oxidase subunit I [Nitrospira defluvii]MCS6326834.1 cytochrome ubiquinol oxidase subunit I [Nitrospira sp.]CAE6694841.1 putative Ubiquinol oxidase (electrogenic, proton-motive force generating) [Nitrospira defluvii]
MKIWQRCLLVMFALVAVLGGVAYAQAPSAPPVEFPYTGNRTAVWIVAQLHILFAGFILGAPIFVVISEWLGYRKQDPRYDRLAKEVTKVTVILYSMTALTGGLFIFVLLATYPQFTTWLINHFFLIFAVVYPLLFIGETIVLYMYFYTWDAWKGEKKARHIALGVLLNLIGSITLFVIDAPTSFMNTPVRAEGISPAEFLATASLWDKVFNYSWMPLNLHRLVGNVTFGGFVAGLIAAYMFMGAKKEEDRAYYDWMGFVGNMIGVGALLFLPFMGYLLAYELCDYDASICPYMMADQLSMFFEMQGAMIGLIFLASNYYIWLSMKRIEGVERVRMTVVAPMVMVLLPIVMTKVLTDYPVPDPTSLAFLLPLLLAPAVLGRFIPLTVSSSTVIKIGFLMVVVGNAIWMTPHGFVPTGAKLVAELELPSDWNFLALMPAKNSAAFTLVFVTVVNYVIYNRAVSQGTIVWGKIDFASQFVLVFLAFSAIWTMGLMGAVRSLLRKYFHTYNLLPDFTAESFTPTLSYSAWWITGITIVFYAVVSFAIIVTLRPSDSKGHAHEGSPVPAGAK